MDDLMVSPTLVIPASELRLSFSRSGGPGGQNVNKVATKVELRWAPAASAALTEPDRELLLQRLIGRLTGDGDLVVTSSRTRDQARNREDALRKLASLVADALERPKLRKRTSPTPRAIQRRLRRKKQRARVKLERRSPTPAE